MPASVIASTVRLCGPKRPVEPVLDSIATSLRYQNGQSTYRDGDPADFWYRIVSGSAHKYALTSSGSRRIVDFLLPDDLFGIGTGGRHRFTVEVIVDGTVIARYPRRLLETLADSDPLISRQIREAAFESIRRLETRMLILGLGRARERVSAFLLEFADRLGARRCQREICLPMSRCEVADYLAIAVETVSRVFTQLRLQGVIQLSGLRNVRVCDWGALERICGWGASSLTCAGEQANGASRGGGELTDQLGRSGDHHEHVISAARPQPPAR